MNKFIMHIMWYEHQMLPETFDSIIQAINVYQQVKPDFLNDWEFIICLNAQTYIENPIEGKDADRLAESVLKHKIFSLLPNLKIIRKTMEHDFYNIGDFRREYYQNDTGYITWGESDCLMPMDFFYIIEGALQSITESHLLSFSSRKMWDNSWKEVEHKSIQNLAEHEVIFPLHCSHYGTQIQLDKANNYDESAEIVKIKKPKVDGSLLSLYKIDKVLIPENLHFVREDLCLQRACEFYHISQYHVVNRFKFHNYGHPQKRVDTESKRSDMIFKQYEKQSILAMNNFISDLLSKK